MLTDPSRCLGRRPMASTRCQAPFLDKSPMAPKLFRPVALLRCTTSRSPRTNHSSRSTTAPIAPCGTISLARHSSRYPGSFKGRMQRGETQRVKSPTPSAAALTGGDHPATVLGGLYGARRRHRALRPPCHHGCARRRDKGKLPPSPLSLAMATHTRALSRCTRARRIPRRRKGRARP